MSSAVPCESLFNLVVAVVDGGVGRKLLLLPATAWLRRIQQQMVHKKVGPRSVGR